jgi:hypothetical protein
MIFVTSMAYSQVLETIEQTSATYFLRTGDSNLGQSFTPTQTGYLSCVAFDIWHPNPQATITVREGNGPAGALLYTEPSAVSWPLGWFTVNLASPVLLTGGQTYTVYSGVSGLTGDARDPYAGGDLVDSSSVVAGQDSAFRMIITADGSPCPLNGDEPAPTEPVPTISTWAGIGLILTLALAGLAILRRRDFKL